MIGSAAACKLPGQPTPRPFGVTLVGNFSGSSGIGEAGRRLALALLSAGVNISLEEAPTLGQINIAWRDPRLDHVRRGRCFPIEIWLINVNEIVPLADRLQRSGGVAPYVIAYWHWELPKLNVTFRSAIDLVDEIWVSSTFSRGAFISLTNKPVIVQPIMVEASAESVEGKTKHYQPGEPTFLVTFDAFASDARKNPWAAIDAYIQAFPYDPCRSKATLIFKILHLNREEVRSFKRAFMDRIGKRRDIVVIDDDLSRIDMNHLIASCDVYVSLHRSEGFGIGVAEAMAAAKPVIATAWSGSMDLVDRRSACLVGYRLRPISLLDHEYMPFFADTYPPGSYWAEPNINQAAKWMRLLADNAQMREAIGRRAYHKAAEMWSPVVNGIRAAQRLAEIASKI